MINESCHDAKAIYDRETDSIQQFVMNQDSIVSTNTEEADFWYGTLFNPSRRNVKKKVDVDATKMFVQYL